MDIVVLAERGSGAGVALTAFASRFWPRRGFRETFLRLYRSIP